MIEARQRGWQRGVTLIEAMIVLAISTLVFLPTLNFMLSSQNYAYRGYDRLETLSFSRIVIEKVRRDLKAYCYDPTHRFQVDGTGAQISFPVFPTDHLDEIPTTDRTRPIANQVTYRFDAARKTLIRKVKYHPRIAQALGKTENTETLAKNVVIFNIRPRVFAKQAFFDVEVKCESLHPKRQLENTHLRASVRSMFVSALERHPFQVPNRLSVVDHAP